MKDLLSRAVVHFFDPENPEVFEEFLLNRRMQIGLANCRYLEMCAYYSRNEREFAAVLDNMTTISVDSLLDFLFSKLALGKTDKFVSIIYTKLMENPSKFQYYCRNSLQIGPVYQYLDDPKMLRILRNFHISFEQVSVDDIMSAVERPKRILPGQLVNHFRSVDHELIIIVLVVRQAGVVHSSVAVLLRRNGVVTFYPMFHRPSIHFSIEISFKCIMSLGQMK